MATNPIDFSVGFDFNFFLDPQGRRIQPALVEASSKRLSLAGRELQTIAKKKIKHKRPTKLQLAKSRGGPPNWYSSTVRERAKKSIEKKLKTRSEPGQPPFSHVAAGERGIRSIFYHFARADMTTIVGPVLFNVGGVPELLEKGGETESVVEVTKRGRKSYVRKRVRIAARPFMRPSLQDFIAGGKFPDLFKDLV